MALAATYNGVPYRWGGTDPASGLDCSGLVQLVYGTLGATLPRVAADQSHAGTAVASVDDARPGDLVFFGKPAHHVGIYVGNGKMIDAPHTGSFVGIHKLWGTPSSIRRIATDPTVTTASVAGSVTGSAAAGPPPRRSAPSPTRAERPPVRAWRARTPTCSRRRDGATGSTRPCCRRSPRPRAPTTRGR